MQYFYMGDFLRLRFVFIITLLLIDSGDCFISNGLGYFLGAGNSVSDEKTDMGKIKFAQSKT